MKPKIYLVCNAHIDPVWLWQWHEGAAEAVSTFRTAVEFCEKYDGFVFNHNEALLYEWVEEYEPALFERIRAQVKAGRWNIIGGWYLQPDCHMPSGESFIRQIKAGRDYFERKFGVRPKTAVNFDSFGHTRGLVQILKKTGYTGYVFMRTGQEHHTFIWRGFDGSEVTAHRIYAGYASLKGDARPKVERFIQDYIENPERGISLGMVTWGVGNHGGGASVPDVEEIKALIDKRVDMELIQSSPEAFLAEVDKTKLEVVEKSIFHCMVGCYTSMARIKQLHRKLENQIEICEKMMAHAAHEYSTAFDNSLEAAKRELMFCEFHDILPGSNIKAAEENAVARLNTGLTIVDKLITKSFFALCAGQQRPEEGELPVMIYNPHPYPISADVEVEFCLSSQNWNEREDTIGIVYSDDGRELPSQNEHSSSAIRLDWRKKLVFTAELAPCAMNRFNCRLKTETDRERLAPWREEDGVIIVTQPGGEVRISRKTGLIEGYLSDGVNYLKDAGAIRVVQDNEDPWGGSVDRFDREIGVMQLMSDKEANTFAGYPEAGYSSVRVLENGAVRMILQAFFQYENTVAVVYYTIPKQHDYLDVSVTMLSGTCNRMYKYSVDAVLEDAQFIGQTAFGTQSMEQEGEEVTFHEWCALTSESGHVTVLNSGTYGGSSDGRVMKLSLLRTPVYSALPLTGRQLAEPERYSQRIDLGERQFAFRIVCGKRQENPDYLSGVYNRPVIALSFYPSGEGEKPYSMAEIDNPAVLMTALAQDEDGYLFRLYNSRPDEQSARVRLFNLTEEIDFDAFGVRTFLYQGGTLKETNMLGEVI